MMRKTQRAMTVLLALSALTCGHALALRRVPVHHSHHGRSRRSHLRRILWNPMFRPSHESLLRQNEEIDRLELPRIQDDDELDRLKVSEDLVPIIPSRTVRIDPRLDPNRRYCRPWTRDFVQDLSEAYYKEFHDQIQVNSAVRTVVVQKKLRRHNRNAAPEVGETASSHLAGITVDLQRRGMTKAEIKWVEQYMLPLKIAGLIEPEEERHQWVFHVAVSGRYEQWRQENGLEERPIAKSSLARAATPDEGPGQADAVPEHERDQLLPSAQLPPSTLSPDGAPSEVQNQY